MPSDEAQYDAFISYKSDDQPFARRLKDALEARDLRVWLDRDEIRPGDLFPTALARGVESSSSLALLISPEALQSGWVEEEYSKALVLANRPGRPRLQIIPVVLREAELPGFVSSRQWVDFRDESAFDDALELLIWGITGRKPERTPPSATRPGSPLTTLPPQPHFAHPYPLQEHFTGRVFYRKLLTDWLTSDNRPILCMTAIGGTGKSALAWAWVQRDLLGSPLPGAVPDSPEDAAACRVPDDSRPHGILWWSFYERESTFSAFLNEALTYTSAGRINPADIPSDYDKARRLLNLLQQGRFLLILDGFERQLRAYASLSAPYQGDAVTEDDRGDFRSCIDPHAARFLQDAAALALPSRLLLTSRLFPRCLDGLAGCRHEDLTNMNLDEAVAFFHAHGIECTRAEVEDICQPYGYHPLSLRLLAGLILADKKSPGDTQVAKQHPILPDLKGKEQHHILQVSYDALDSRKRKLLSSIAAFRSPMTYDAIAIFNPWKTEETFDAALQELIDRGLLLHDRERSRYDLHPIVRQHAYDRLADKTGTHTRLRDYFAAVPTPGVREARTLDDLTPTIELYHHTVRAGRYDQANYLLYGQLVPQPLYFRLAAYDVAIELLRALFPDGESELPRLSDESHQAWVLSALAVCYKRCGQPRRTLPLLAMSNALHERAGAGENLASGSCSLASVQLVLGNLKAAQAALRHSLDLIGDGTDLFAEGAVRLALGTLLLRQSMFDDATSELDTAFSIFEKLGTTQAQGVVWAQRCLCGLLTADSPAALQAAREANAIAQALAADGRRNERDIVEAEWLQGAALLALADDEAKRDERLREAESHLTDALTRCRRINLIELEPDILLAWAKWHQLKGDLAQARKDADEALRIADRCEYRLKEADCHNFLAALSREQGDTNAAIEHADTAYRRAWCDGPPHCYKPALDEAARLLKELDAEPPRVP